MITKNEIKMKYSTEPIVKIYDCFRLIEAYDDLEIPTTKVGFEFVAALAPNAKAFAYMIAEAVKDMLQNKLGKKSPCNYLLLDNRRNIVVMELRGRIIHVVGSYPHTFQVDPPGMTRNFKLCMDSLGVVCTIQDGDFRGADMYSFKITNPSNKEFTETTSFDLIGDGITGLRKYESSLLEELLTPFELVPRAN